MRESPSIIPWGDLDRTVYLVLDDFGGRYGWAIEGQYSSPVRIVVFNTAEGWSRDVTEEIAVELAQAWLAKACADRGEMPLRSPSGTFVGYDRRGPARRRSSERYLNAR